MLKRLHIASLCLTLAAIAAQAQCVVTPTDVRLHTIATQPDTTPRRNPTADSVQLAFRIHFDGEPLQRRQAYIITPRLATDTDSIDFPSIGVYGHDIYYHYLRRDINIFQGPDDMMFRAKYCPTDTAYARAIAFRPWMTGATLKLMRTDITACGNITDTTLPATTTLRPDTTITPIREVEVKQETTSLSGTARIEFIVNRTEIRPEHRRNASELQAIRDAIESITADTTLRLHHITLTGYASPEGTYANNTRLAAGRTEALKQYIASIMHLDTATISTESVPEDWQGFRRYVEASTLTHRDDIIAIIDTEADPDDKLRRIQTTFPADYRTILADAFPPLRRTDYTIAYTRRRTWQEEHIMLNDTTVALPTGQRLPDTHARLRPYVPFMALKTNMLFDALACPNFEIEIPFGRERQFSVMAEYWFPWYIWRHNSNAYQLLNWGAEFRYWWSRCNATRAPLTGHFIGIYGAGGYYDFEWHSDGEQGEYASAGVTYGYSWPIRRRLNLELSISAGVIWGPQRHYEGQFNDTHLIWQYNHNLFYVGPTKLKLSLVWLLFNTHHREARRAQLINRKGGDGR